MIRFSLNLVATVLGIEANWEALTSAAWNYRNQKVYPYFQSKGFQVVLLPGPQAERYYAAPQAAQPSVTYLTGCGHGNVNVYAGYFNHPVFTERGYAPQEVTGKIAHFLSCLTAQQLGPNFVANGCLAYFGYDQDFYVIFGAHEADFFECDATIDFGFADGQTAAEVYDRVMALYNEKIAQYNAAGSYYVAATLAFNRDHLRCPSSGAQWGTRMQSCTDTRKMAQDKPRFPARTAPVCVFERATSSGVP